MTQSEQGHTDCERSSKNNNDYRLPHVLITNQNGYWIIWAMVVADARSNFIQHMPHILISRRNPYIPEIKKTSANV